MKATHKIPTMQMYVYTYLAQLYRQKNHNLWRYRKNSIIYITNDIFLAKNQFFTVYTKNYIPEKITKTCL